MTERLADGINQVDAVTNDFDETVTAARESKEGISEVSQAIGEQIKSSERFAASVDDAANGIDGIRKMFNTIAEATDEQRAAVAELREAADEHAVAESRQTPDETSSDRRSGR